MTAASTIRPSARPTTRSARAASAGSCVTCTTAVPAWAGREARRSRISARPAASSIDVDSSEMSRAGRLAMAAAMARRCNCPPDSDSVLAGARPARPTEPRSASTSTGYPGGSPQRRSSPTVLPITCASARCPTTAVPPGSPSPTRPGRRTEPLVGSAPASSDTSVDFPAPFGPTTATNSPGSTTRSTSTSASRPDAVRWPKPDSGELERHRRDGRVRRGVGARGGVEQIGLREPFDTPRGEDHEGVREEHLRQHADDDHRRDHDRPGAEERVGDADHGVTGRGGKAKELGDVDEAHDGRAYRPER